MGAIFTDTEISESLIFIFGLNSGKIENEKIHSEFMFPVMIRLNSEKDSKSSISSLSNRLSDFYEFILDMIFAVFLKMTIPILLKIKKNIYRLES